MKEEFVSIEVYEEPDPFPLWTMVMVEEAWPSMDPDKIADALGVLEKIYPDTLGKKMNKSMIFDWPDFEDYAAEPCPICEKFHAGAEPEEEWDLSTRVRAMHGRCPTCGSPDPMKHPNAPSEYPGRSSGVVICGDPFHDPHAKVHGEVYQMDPRDMIKARQLKYYEGLPK